MVLGHEVAGVVDAVGPGVGALQPGDKVAVNPSRPCGDCAYCREGLRNQCAEMRFNGSAMRFPHEQGLFQALLTVSAAQAVQLSAGTDLAQAACAEPLAVCLHAVRRAGGLLGARVLVSGAGPIGCLMAVVAARAGAQEVIVTDLAAAPLAIATALGANRTINLATEPGALEPLAAGKGTVDCLFECSGAPAAFASALALVRPQGRLMLVGLGAEVSLPLAAAVTKELQIAGSFLFDAEFAFAADLIDRGAVDQAPLITHSLPVARAVEAFATASDRSRAMKVQLDFTTN